MVSPPIESPVGPDLKARAPMHPGRGPGLTDRRLGQKLGVTTVTVTQQQLPSHTHALQGSTDSADLNAPATNRSLARTSGAFSYQQDTTNNLGAMDTLAVLPVGSGGAHNNQQPLLGLFFIIALVGTFPSRN